MELEVEVSQDGGVTPDDLATICPGPSSSRSTSCRRVDVLLQEGRQHDDADDIREQLSALCVGQRRHAVDDGSGGAEDEALHLGRVHQK
jgi:hypothetical protein